MGAIVLHSSSRLPPDSAPNIIWIQKKEDQIELIKLISDVPFPEPSFICLSKVPVNEPPPGSPKGAVWRELHVSRAFFSMSLEFLIKFLPIKRHFILLSKALGKQRPPMFPKTGPVCKQTPISRALLSISFGVPSKRALSPGSPHRAPTDRDAPFPDPSFSQYSQAHLGLLPEVSPIPPPSTLISNLNKLTAHLSTVHNLIFVS
jgi:hypothetical protein